MRQKRRFYFCLLVVIAILSLGIGFAAISSTLYFTGTVETATDLELTKNFIVKFQSATVYGKSDDIDVAEIVTKEDLSVKFNVQGMSETGSYVTFELVIANESADLYANGATFEVYNYASNQITGASQMGTNSAGQYITTVWNQTNPFYTITITKTTADSGQIAPGGTQTYQVKIEMTAVPSEQKTDDFTIKFIYNAGSYAYTG